MPKRKSDAFDISLTDAEKEQLASDLCADVEDAFSARSSVIQDGGKIDLFDWYYEQGASDPRSRPFPGAADLTSYIITEKVDALRARILKTIFGVEPFCVVEAWGTDAAKAPAVEAFHEWQIHEEGLPEELAKCAHGALIEDGFVLEVRERIDTKRIVDEIDAALELGDDGAPVFADGEPKLQVDDQGEYVKAEQGQQSAKIRRDRVQTRRLGPEYDCISLKDFVFLPGHAKNQRAVWGYAYRCFERLHDLQEKVKDKIYDAAAVEVCGETSDRDGTNPAPVAVVDTVTSQSGVGPNAEKELFQLSIKRDFDGDGREEWYLVTLSIQHRQILRLKLDTFVMKVGKPRCVFINLFPRRNSVYGYSYAEKLLTLAEEHTALRNMKADRGALATNAPMKRLATALWNPDEQPFGVGRTIDVRDMAEVQQMEVSDVPNGVIEQERAIQSAAERVGGLADTAVGVQSTEARTLGENQLAATGSAIRVDEPISHMRTAISTIYELRHAIWLDVLENDPKGLEAPATVVDSLSQQGVTLNDGRFTAEQLRGTFRFKPYGSVETADSGRQMQYFNQWLQMLSNLSQANPMFGQVLQSPEVVKSIMEEGARIYKVRNAQVFLKALTPPPVMGLPAAGGMDAAAPQGPGMPSPGLGGAPEGLAGLLAQMGGAQGVQ